jgi:hypothetical protein
MREATEAWQVEIGDTGLVPEAVLMEEMKPHGKSLATAPPTITRAGGFVTLKCETEGASIVYQTPNNSSGADDDDNDNDNDNWGDWRLYVKSFPHSGPLRAQACRLGYLNSKVAEFAPERP